MKLNSIIAIGVIAAQSFGFTTTTFAGDYKIDKQKSKLNDKKVKQYIYLFDSKASTVKKVEVTTGIQDDQFIIVKNYAVFINNMQDINTPV